MSSKFGYVLLSPPWEISNSFSCSNLGHKTLKTHLIQSKCIMFRQCFPGIEFHLSCAKYWTIQEITHIQTFKLIRFDWSVWPEIISLFSNAGDKEQAIRHEWLLVNSRMSGRMIKNLLASQFVLTPELLHLLCSFDLFKMMLQESGCF